MNHMKHMQYIKCMQYLSYSIITLFLTSTLSFANTAKATGFLNQQNTYKGFYWFEKSRANNTKDTNGTSIVYQIPTAAEATLQIEQRKKRLDDARAQMIAIGFDKHAPLSAKREAIIAYKKLELEMWDGAITLAEQSDMANFINPELADTLRQPTNVFGAKLQRQMEAEKSLLSISQFAKDFDLLLFASESCSYSREFLPVLRSFASQNHFTLDIASLESNAGSIASRLGITNTPTLVAVKKDGSQCFEISRGMVSSSQLEANILLAQKYSEELDLKKIKWSIRNRARNKACAKANLKKAQQL
jgi:hypothetical protein